jgi:hypothetical protein
LKGNVRARLRGDMLDWMGNKYSVSWHIFSYGLSDVCHPYLTHEVFLNLVFTDGSFLQRVG